MLRRQRLTRLHLPHPQIFPAGSIHRDWPSVQLRLNISLVSSAGKTRATVALPSHLCLTNSRPGRPCKTYHLPSQPRLRMYHGHIRGIQFAAAPPGNDLTRTACNLLGRLSFDIFQRHKACSRASLRCPLHCCRCYDCMPCSRFSHHAPICQCRHRRGIAQCRTAHNHLRFCHSQPLGIFLQDTPYMRSLLWHRRH